MRFRAALKCVLLLLVLAVPFVSEAQQNASTVHGTVIDPDQLVVPGATVTLTSTSGKTLTATSKTDGSYSIANVPAGTYSFTATMAGFAAFVRTGIRVTAGQPLTLDVKMSVEAEATEVNVTTQTNQVSVDQDSNASATVIKGKDLDALSDDPDELQSELSALAGPAAGPNGGQIYVDGFTGGTLPPKSSIREIRVNQNPFSAQYDRLGFGRVEVFTRPGTDKYHGNLNVQGNQRLLNTNNPFVATQPDYFTLFLMGSVSGPLTKVSSFTLAGNYRDIEDNNLISGATLYATSASPTAICPPGQVTGCSVFTYSAAVAHPQKRYQISPRIDWALGDKNTLTVRYQFVDGSNKNNNIGNFNLQARGQDTTIGEHQIQISDSQIFSTRVINETRFEWQREINNASPQNIIPAITVNGNFSTGGSPAGISNATNDHFEFQNYTSLALTKHFIRMGGRLRAERQILTSTSGQNGTFTYSALLDPCTDPSLSTRPTGCATGVTAPCAIANRGFSSYQCGWVNQYSVALIKQPSSTAWLNDVGFYAEDDWKLKPNFTISAGLRLEAQNAISSAHDIAPRISFAWGVPNKKGSPTTVIRAGYGIFYDRFDLTQVMNTFRQNGTAVQQSTLQATATNPIPSACNPSNPTACAANTAGRNTIYTIGGPTRSSYTSQFAIGVDRQIGRASVSANYLNAQGVHQYMNRAFADPSAINYRYDSGGVFRQNQLFINGNYRPNAMISLFGFYSLSFARGNTSGATFTPTRVSSTVVDYGRTSFDIRHRMTLVSSMNFKHGISASPFIIANSGSPYNILAGQDVNGDSVYNDRPAFLPGQNSASCTDRNTFSVPTTNVTTYQQIPINYCQGPANFTFNLRVGKVFGFGKRNGGGAQQGQGPGGPGGRGGFGAGGGPPRGGGGNRGGGGGPMMMGGGANSGKKYTLNIGAQAFNLFNVVNRAAPVGTLTSAQFGRSNQLSGGAFGQSTAAVRRITLQLSFNF